jgi:hypothetical protein
MGMSKLPPRPAYRLPPGPTAAGRAVTADALERRLREVVKDVGRAVRETLEPLRARVKAVEEGALVNASAAVAGLVKGAVADALAELRAELRADLDAVRREFTQALTLVRDLLQNQPVPLAQVMVPDGAIRIDVNAAAPNVILPEGAINVEARVEMPPPRKTTKTIEYDSSTGRPSVITESEV